jgi:hypothetical protein
MFRRVAAIILLATISTPALAKEPVMSHAKGEFEVKLVPVSAADEPVMRMSIDKQFHGDLEATSIGQMMAGGNEANGARVYVALERKLHPRTPRYHDNGRAGAVRDRRSGFRDGRTKGYIRNARYPDY